MSTANLPTIFAMIKQRDVVKHWHNFSNLNLQNILNLAELPAKATLIYQIPPQIELNSIDTLTKNGINIIAISNTPDINSSLLLYQHGVKGITNSFCSASRATQIIETVVSGGIWVSPQIMQAMIGQLNDKKTQSNVWQDNLSQREIETTEWVLQGLSNNEIAEKLEISERTVKAHLKSVFTKLNVKDRLYLVLKINKK
jgi:DNA-binding NarL/FixJ family response regulator